MSNYPIFGCYYYPNSSQHIKSYAHLSHEQITLVDSENTTLLSSTLDDCQLDSPLPGMASELNFADGGRFIPQDVEFRWPFALKEHGLSERLEKNKILIVASVLLIPLLLWLILYRLIPSVAVYSVNLAPGSTIETMGEQTLSVIEKVALEPSQLSTNKQSEIQQQWRLMLNSLNLDSAKFRLSFYQSDYFSANAFALPNGQVVVTDELVDLLKNDPDALRAILLHEIGHVQHHHSIRLAAQAAASTVVFAVIFGDLEGILEVVLGSGSSFLQQAFSRDMEQEADVYAIKNLLKLGYSNHDFADAIEALENNLKAQEGTYDDTWLKYLSTHPSSQERIEYARQYKPE